MLSFQDPQCVSGMLSPHEKLMEKIVHYASRVTAYSESVSQAFFPTALLPWPIFVIIIIPNVAPDTVCICAFWWYTGIFSWQIHELVQSTLAIPELDSLHDKLSRMLLSAQVCTQANAEQVSHDILCVYDDMNIFKNNIFSSIYFFQGSEKDLK